MTQQLPPAVLSKPHALEKYQKPERTFQRRLSIALRFHDDEFLKHFYLATSDGRVRRGTDVGDGEVERLKGEGLYPVWHVEEEWFSNEYDQRSRRSVRTDTPTSKSSLRQSTPTVDRGSFDRPALVAEIESLHREIASAKTHNSLLSRQLEIKDQQITAANERWKESNILTNELHTFMQNMEQRFLTLGRSERVSQHPPTSDSVEAAITVPSPEMPRPEKGRPSDRVPRIVKKRGSQASAIPGAATKRKLAKPTEPRKPKWYESLTLKRFFPRD